jgi:HTH-type transcriptional regulator / antitoxin HipB
MIQNERQYKISRSKLKDLELARTSLDNPDPSLHPRQLLGRKKSLNLTISSLRQEIEEYENLKKCRGQKFTYDSLRELPTVLIKARIAAGMTQRELAEKIDIQEQQIQRYEADLYSKISFDRLRQIAEILGVEDVHPDL